MDSAELIAANAVPGLSLQVQGFVLEKSPRGDRFQPLALFSPEQGLLRCYQRISLRNPGPAIDLFDELSATLTSSNQGHTWFFKELHVDHRHPGIGLRFEALAEASALAALIVRNPVHEEGRARICRLLRETLGALETGAPAAIVGLKALYSFARDEGYPVKEEWLAGLRGSEREHAVALLHTPIASIDADLADHAPRILARLRRYLKESTELTIAGD
jgi:hypothetical protein